MQTSRIKSGLAGSALEYLRHRLMLPVLIGGFVVLAGATLSDANQIPFLAVAFLGLGAAGWSSRWSDDFSRVLLILVSAFLSLRYWMFRTTATLAFMGLWDFVFMGMLYCAETYGILIYFMGLFVNLSPLKRRPPPLPADPDALPTVDVFIPTYEEPVEIVHITAVACTQLDYPADKLNIYVLDDGGTAQKLSDPNPRKAAAARRRALRLREMARRLGIHYAARDNNLRAKAGNINANLMAEEFRTAALHPDKAGCVNHGVGFTEGELILVLDCDHVPTRDLLQRTVGFFLQDEKLFLVQTPHFFINPTPVEKNLETFGNSPSENEMFYGGVHPGLDFWNASFFCGSAALLRRKYLLENGGLAGDTVTEDAETALGLHNRGLNSVYLNKPMTIGLSPETFDDFIVQRSRWAQGMIQILLLKNPLRQRGLTAAQRICYLNACLHWLFGFARIVFFISPLLFLFLGLRVYNASVEQVLLFAVPHLLGAYFVSNRLYGQLRHPFFSELFETIQSIFLVPAILAVFLRPRAPRFRVTPKSVARSQDRLTPLAAPFYVMFLLTLAAYPAAAVMWSSPASQLGTIVICLAWNTFNMLLMLCCLGVVWERRQLRQSHRFRVREPVRLRMPSSGETVDAVLCDLSVTGVGLELDRGIFPTDGDFVLLAADGLGRSYELPLKVSRRQESENGLMLGCRFDIVDERMERRIIGFVFGDSRRWKYFHEKRTRRKINTITGLGNLAKIGLRGFLRHLRGIGIAGWTRISSRVKGRRRSEQAVQVQAAAYQRTHQPPGGRQRGGARQPSGIPQADLFRHADDDGRSNTRPPV